MSVVAPIADIRRCIGPTGSGSAQTERPPHGGLFEIRSGDLSGVGNDNPCPLLPNNGQNVAVPRMSAKCHVWTAPSWQELSSRLQHWSVQPCVRPLSAAHRAAGHNALRGSGPGHKHAFDNALAQMGCPDRRIDRHCITCCSPFPTFTSRRMFDAISFTPQARRVPCNARPWPSWPRPSARSCWQARWRRPWWAAAPTMPRARADAWCHLSWHSE